MKRSSYSSLAYISLLVLHPTEMSTSSNNHFCNTLNSYAEIVNYEMGSMIDRITKKNGMWIVCNSKIIDFKYISLVNEVHLDNEWKKRIQSNINKAYCKNSEEKKELTQATKKGWKIFWTYTFPDAETCEFHPVCQQLHLISKSIKTD